MGVLTQAQLRGTGTTHRHKVSLLSVIYASPLTLNFTTTPSSTI